MIYSISAPTTKYDREEPGEVYLLPPCLLHAAEAETSCAITCLWL